METQKERRVSRIGRALSWIAHQSGAADSPSQNNEQAMNSTNRIRRRRPRSLHSFLPKHNTSPTNNADSSGGVLDYPVSMNAGIIDRLRVASSVMIASSTSSMRSAAATRGGSESGSEPERTPEHVGGARRRRPPPFFYSRPLSTILDGMAIDVDSGEHATQDGDVSVSSVNSSEIALWKMKGKRASGTPVRRGRFESFKSLLSPSLRARSPSVLKVEDEPYTPVTPDISLVDVEPIVLSSTPTIYDHPFGTSRSRSPSTISRGLSPPPRPKRQPSQGRSRSPSRRQFIDPAKWAEISISAAELVSRFGEGNVLFYPSAPSMSISTGRDSFETRSDSLDEARTVGDESFIELEDECTPLRQTVDKDLDIEVSRDSMATASMISFSKWPLPPQCDRFLAQ